MTALVVLILLGVPFLGARFEIGDARGVANAIERDGPVLVADPLRRGRNLVITRDAGRWVAKLVAEMDDELQRHVREGLSEEELALFDMLLKENISKTAGMGAGMLGGARVGQAVIPIPVVGPFAGAVLGGVVGIGLARRADWDRIAVAWAEPCPAARSQISSVG